MTDYRIHGMDCAEEVRVLKRALAPLVPEEAVTFEYTIGGVPHKVARITGDCRRHSPIVMVDTDFPAGHAAMWPAVAEDDFCGDFETAGEDRGIEYVWFGMEDTEAKETVKQ